MRYLFWQRKFASRAEIRNDMAADGDVIGLINRLRIDVSTPTA
jgi:hypothetical protein